MNTRDLNNDKSKNKKNNKKRTTRVLNNKTNKQKDSNNNKKNTKTNKQGIAKYFTTTSKPKNIVLSIFVTTLKMFIIFLIIAGFASFGAVIGVAKGYLDSTPELNTQKISQQKETSIIYDDAGNRVTEYHGIENRLWVPIEEVPDMLKNAFIAVEDARFYAHNGLDYVRLFGAFVNNLQSQSVQGGSTITQQLIKNTILSFEQSYKRKIQEMYLATELEKKYSKDEILECYLNTIYLGGGNYGVQAAANGYFVEEGQPPMDLDNLTIRQCALIAGITKNPYYYDPQINFNPDNTSRSKDITYKRTNLVLRLMYQHGYITKEEYELNKFNLDGSNESYQEFKIIPKKANSLYPHMYFIEYVIDDVAKALVETQDDLTTINEAKKYIREGGLRIYTTMDSDVQQKTEDAVYNFNVYPRLKNPNDNMLWDNAGNEIQQPQAAAVVVDHHTGELKAIVGGRSEPGGFNWTNRANQAWPPGSAIKPLAVYGPFIEAGYPGGIIIENVKAPVLNWKTQSGKTYPSNCGGSKYYGPLDVRTAMKKSLNIVAARIVTERVKPEYSANKLSELGITESSYIQGLSASNLSLGSSDVNMIEMAGAYSTIANKGIYQRPVSFTKVTDKDGYTILTKEEVQEKRRVFSEDTTFILTSFMQDVVRPGGTAPKASFRNMHIAGKTGTNSDHKGLFFGGFTPYYTTTVCIVHDRRKAFASSTYAGSHTAPLWKEIMEPIHEELDDKSFYDSVPENVVRKTVCPVSGMLPTDNCDFSVYDSVLKYPLKPVTEYFIKDYLPNKKCDWCHEVEVDVFSGKLPSPYCPPEHKTTKTIVIPPEDSPYREMSVKDKNTIMPYALFDFTDIEDILSLNLGVPEYNEYLSPHSEQWAAAEKIREEKRVVVDSLIGQVNANINNAEYAAYLQENQRAQLEAAIEALSESVDKGFLEIPEEPLEEPITEFEIFDPAPVDNNIQILSELNKNIFDQIRKTIEESQQQEPPSNPNDDQDNESDDEGSGDVPNDPPDQPQE